MTQQTDFKFPDFSTYMEYGATMKINSLAREIRRLEEENAALRATGPERRDQGAAKVLANAGDDFQVRAMDTILWHWSGKEGTGEDFRRTCEDNGIRPHHANAWGAVILALKRQGHLKETGEWRNMRAAKSHARATRVYLVG